MLTIDPLVVSADAVDAAKTYLRIEQDEEDALIASLLGAAIRHCESFLGLLLIRRNAVDRMPVSAAWQRLSVLPVQSITSVTGIPAEGATFTLPVGAYALDIDSSGDGWVRVTQPGLAQRVEVRVLAGLAAGWDDIPEPMRLAVLRLTAHLHAYRDAPGDIGPPAAVAALLRPHRRMQFA
jgi:uncharacterized phiE125 gp8 family phage protein